MTWRMRRKDDPVEWIAYQLDRDVYERPTFKFLEAHSIQIWTLSALL